MLDVIGLFLGSTAVLIVCALKSISREELIYEKSEGC
jgi:hypothetical protein